MAFTFGSTTTPATSNTFGGFGASSSAAPSFGANTGGFGNTSNPSGFGTATSGALGFGAATSSAPSTGFSLGNQPGPSGGFSMATQPASTGFSLGNQPQTTTSGAPSTGFSLGNQPQTSTFAPSTGFSFGTTAGGLGSSTGGFGSTTGGFGSTGGFGGFGSKPGSSLFGNTSEQQKKQREQQVYQLLCEINKDAEASTVRKGYEAKNVWQALALLKSYYDPKSPHCRFRHYFYNLVSPQEVHLYQKPEDHDPEEWKAAQKANPDPTKMVPALAIGFDDVQKRMDQQYRLSEAHDTKLKELETILNKIKTSRLVETAAKLNECKQRHMETVQRLIKFLKYAQVLRNKGLSITPEEEAMRTRFENIQQQLQKSELFHGKLNQLWAQLQLIKESGRKYGRIDGVEEWHAVSEQHMNEITKNLGEQNKGIQHIIEVIHKDTTSVENMNKRYEFN
ncbi:hypothetical protein G6F46_006190 [Rhizopus delemar]|nr:hypothetical protein G6F55_001399 [Rhizopus delemar]KAG1544114.1 hypothetical protein G6F51_006261 [Rhizopus arrhizus]KAG1496819.1 hypothetical protein G6F54_006204 [Rhizopus delemar]KAG1507910.1 hypothetical protein G6F53_008589 [Rhizopus delemar]KAG1509733.1 hypothetical protein G6F52_011072 [Rhizopus delemar]